MLQIFSNPTEQTIQGDREKRLQSTYSNHCLNDIDSRGQDIRIPFAYITAVKPIHTELLSTGLFWITEKGTTAVELKHTDSRSGVCTLNEPSGPTSNTHQRDGANKKIYDSIKLMKSNICDLR